MPEYISVSLNKQFIAKEEFSSFVLHDGDVVEFLYDMGGAAAKMICAIMGREIRYESVYLTGS